MLGKVGWCPTSLAEPLRQQYNFIFRQWLRLGGVDFRSFMCTPAPEWGSIAHIAFWSFKLYNNELHLTIGKDHRVVAMSEPIGCAVNISNCGSQEYRHTPKFR